VAEKLAVEAVDRISVREDDAECADLESFALSDALDEGREGVLVE
jgi:hypothetical protein